MTKGLSWPDSIEDYVLSALRAVSITVPADILSYDEFSLSKTTGLSVATCAITRKAVVGLFAIQGELAGHYLAKRVLLSCGISGLDSVLDGGLSIGWLTEIYGEAGAGKTQFCLTLAANSLERGHAVFWIDTEGSFRTDRLAGIMAERCASLDNLSVARCFNVTEFLACIESVTLFSHNADVPPLLIIDSIAAIVKHSTLSKQELSNIATTLKSMNCFVMCSNHVVANFAAHAGPESYKPALGSTWDTRVTCRFHIQHECDGRNIHVTKSPTCGPSTVPLRMTPAGLQ